MELLRIEGTRTELLGLSEVEELHLVGPSAIDRGDGSWLVSVYAPEGAAERLRERGLTVHPLKPAAQVRDEWAAAAPAPAEAAVEGYLPPSALTQRLERLADAHPDVCASEVLEHRTHEGREVRSLSIGTGAAAAVVVIGGVHAREWAPPDALLSLAEGLVDAYARSASFEHPEWVDRSGREPVSYGAWSVPADEVKRLVESVTLVLFPLVNPDGRAFSLADANDELHRMWRKNRRPPAPGGAGPWCYGVDLNRNFDLAWDFERYYNRAAAREVRSSKRPCDPEIFIGPSAASEPETRNVQALVERHRPAHFMDVHSYSRAILFPWGMDDDQGVDPDQSFRNRDWDRDGAHGGRDGVGGRYGEFLPGDLSAAHQAIGRRMHDAIRDQAGSDPTARRRSIYTVKQALGLYPTTGTSDDWCVGLSMLVGSDRPILGFCLECGIDQSPGDPADDEGGFHPDYRLKFPKIEREVHAAVLALVRAAAA
jgi:carboxypeptidase T